MFAFYVPVSKHSLRQLQLIQLTLTFITSLLFQPSPTITWRRTCSIQTVMLRSLMVPFRSSFSKQFMAVDAWLLIISATKSILHYMTLMLVPFIHLLCAECLLLKVLQNTTTPLLQTPSIMPTIYQISLSTRSTKTKSKQPKRSISHSSSLRLISLT